MNAITKHRLKGKPPKVEALTKSKILVYGKPSAGKTWAACDFPAVYMIDTEGGAKEKRYMEKLEMSGGMYFGPDQGSTSFDEVLGQIKALCTVEHSFKTVVIDSISKLFALEVSHEAERLTAEGKKNEFSADRKPAVTYMRSLVAWLMRLDMNVVLTAYSKSEWARDASGERVEIGETFDCWDRLEYELDLALHIYKQGSSRRARVRKTRLGAFPEGHTFGWSYDEFANLYGREIIEGDVKTLALATPEQLAEVTRLLSIVKTPDDQVDKWFKAANVSSWEDMDTDRVEKCVEYLKGKMV